MKVRYDYDSCASFHLCVSEWDAISEEQNGSKIEIEGTTETDGAFVRELSQDEEEAAIAAAKACPVDAIVIEDADGNQIGPD